MDSSKVYAQQPQNGFLSTTKKLKLSFPRSLLCGLFNASAFENDRPICSLARTQAAGILKDLPGQIRLPAEKLQFHKSGASFQKNRLLQVKTLIIFCWHICVSRCMRWNARNPTLVKKLLASFLCAVNCSFFSENLISASCLNPGSVGGHGRIWCWSLTVEIPQNRSNLGTKDDRNLIATLMLREQTTSIRISCPEWLRHAGMFPFSFPAWSLWEDQNEKLSSELPIRAKKFFLMPKSTFPREHDMFLWSAACLCEVSTRSCEAVAIIRSKKCSWRYYSFYTLSPPLQKQNVHRHQPL